MAEKGQSPVHLGHPVLLRSGEPGSAGWSGKICDGEKGGAVGASAELGRGERSEVNCRIKGIKELC